MIHYSLPNPNQEVSMLDLLITVRHGAALPDNTLGQRGIEAVEKTSQAIRRLILDRQFVILASPVGRAQQTARILAAQLGGTFETHPCLQENFDHWTAIRLATEKGQTCRVVIVVTHQPGENFPREFWNQIRGFQNPIGYLPLETGQASCLNVRSGAFRYVD